MRSATAGSSRARAYLSPCVRRSLDNLRRLADPKSGVDIGFVQGGLAGQVETDELHSLGSIFYTPVYLFYRSPKPIARLSSSPASAS